VTVERQKVVLIVDDEPVIRRVLRKTLEIANYTVIEAADGVEALDVLDRPEQHVSAVLSDITMPRMDGLVLADRVRHAHPKVPVILTSGRHSRASIPRAVAEQIDGFLDKPYSKSSVLSIIAVATGRPHDT